MTEGPKYLPDETRRELEAQLLPADEAAIIRGNALSDFIHHRIGYREFGRIHFNHDTDYGRALQAINIRATTREKILGYQSMSTDELLATVEPECRRAEFLIRSAELWLKM